MVDRSVVAEIQYGLDPGKVVGMKQASFHSCLRDLT